jgi:TonB family protein
MVTKFVGAVGAGTRARPTTVGHLFDHPRGNTNQRGAAPLDEIRQRWNRGDGYGSELQGNTGKSVAQPRPPAGHGPTCAFRYNNAENMSLVTQQLGATAAFGLLLMFSTAGWSEQDTMETDTPAAPATTGRFETHVQFLDRTALEEFDLAADLGTRLIDLVEAEDGPTSMGLADVLTEVGEVQRLAKEYEAAERNLLRAIDIYQSLDGHASEKLVKPMVSLGLNYSDSDRDAPAVVMFSEARSIDRRNNGLLHEGQLAIIGYVTESYINLGEYEQAHRKQLEGLQLSQRIHGIDTMASLPAIYTYAAFLKDMGNYDEARFFYNRAIRVIYENRSKLDPALAYPLREIGNSFREQVLPESLGAGSIKRCIEILEQAEFVDHLELALCYRDLGDWFTAFSRVGTGSEQYEKAWQLLEHSEAGPALRDRWFATKRPEFVRYQPMSRRGLRTRGSEPGLQEGFVTIQFDLLANGRTDNVIVLESEPAGGKDESALRSIRNSRLRPSIVDGKVIRTEGLIRRYVFSYKPSAF